MPEEERASNGAATGAGARLRRPTLERVEPRRGWTNLYAPGKADAPGAEAGNHQAAGNNEAAPASGEAPTDAASRVIRDGYRVVEENLRRGRQVAAELRGVRREVSDFANRIDAPKLVSNLTQTVIDPALTEQVLGVARSLFSALGALVPAAPAAAAPVTPPPAARPVPLHPQERPDYQTSGARVLKLRSVGAGEWLADLEIDGQVRRVQVRAVDGDL